MSEHLCDMHSHLLPGIDDGSKNWKMTLEMIRQSYEAGVRIIVATPHYLPWRHTMIADRVPELCDEAMTRAEEKFGIRMLIFPGQELYYHVELPQALEEGRALTLAGTNKILVEFSEQIPYEDMRRALDQLGRAGYQVILAHCERFGCLRESGRIEEVMESGTWLQSNVQEMEAGVFDGTKKWLTQRYQKREIRFLGSDMHNLTTRPPMSDKALKWFRRNLDPEYFRDISCTNTERMLLS